MLRGFKEWLWAHLTFDVISIFVWLIFCLLCCKITFLLYLGYSFLLCVGISFLLWIVLLDFWKVNCVNLVWSWNILVSPSMLIETFAGYSNLGWHLWYLWICMRSSQELWAFIHSCENAEVILISLTLYVTWSFSVTALNISLFTAFDVLIILCQGYFLYCSTLFEVFSWPSLSLGYGSFLL